MNYIEPRKFSCAAKKCLKMSTASMKSGKGGDEETIFLVKNGFNHKNHHLMSGFNRRIRSISRKSN